MPAAYSADIRGRVIASVKSGSSRREAAEEFDVSASSAIKWVAACRTTGAAKPRGVLFIFLSLLCVSLCHFSKAHMPPHVAVDLDSLSSFSNACAVFKSHAS
jgi:hypothetical protein